MWNALKTSHRHLALARGLALKYPADVAPFAAVAENSLASFADLHSLMLPGETTYVAGPPPATVPELAYGGVLPCLQMYFPRETPLPAASGNAMIEPLTEDHAAEMVTLTDVAFPGLFRIRTCAMGRYFGIRDSGGQLIAMGGERFVLDPIREISGLCTHPNHRERGYAALLLGHLLSLHRREGSISCLHVVTTNTNAIQLYHRVGFETLREVDIHRLTRSDALPQPPLPQSASAGVS
jgi:ribosomal protein S18 acetylase RimI-like enzyme